MPIVDTVMRRQASPTSQATSVSGWVAAADRSANDSDLVSDNDDAVILDKNDVAAAMATGRATYGRLLSRSYGDAYERIIVNNEPTHYVRCRRCKFAVLKYACVTSATPSSLLAHSSRCKHSDARQPMIDSVFTTSKRCDPEKAARDIRSAVVDFVSVEGLPFDLVESAAFRDLIQRSMEVGKVTNTASQESIPARRTLTVSTCV